MSSSPSLFPLHPSRTGLEFRQRAAQTLVLRFGSRFPFSDPAPELTSIHPAVMALRLYLVLAVLPYVLSVLAGHAITKRHVTKRSCPAIGDIAIVRSIPSRCHVHALTHLLYPRQSRRDYKTRSSTAPLDIITATDCGLMP